MRKKAVITIWVIFTLFLIISIPYFYKNSLKLSERSLKIKGKNFIETITPSIINSIKFSLEIDKNLFREMDLLSEVLLEENITKEKLFEYSLKFNLFGITILDNKNYVLSSTLYPEGYIVKEEKIRRAKEKEISEDTLFFYKESKRKKILILKDISSIKLLKREYGIRNLINEISKDPEIDYFLFQSPEGVVFSAKLPERLKTIKEDEFLKMVINSDTVLTRITTNKNRKIIEFAKSIEILGEKEGILRVGFLMNEYLNFQKNFQNFFLLFISFFILYLLLSLISFKILKEYEKVKPIETTFNILKEIYELAFLLTKKDGEIIYANRYASNILGEKKLIGKKIFSMDEMDIFKIKKVIEENKEIEFEEKIGEKIFHGKAGFLIYENNTFIFSFLKDITNIKEKYREEKLSGFNEFLADLAHEIKNPLNLMSLTIKEIEDKLASEEIQKLKRSYSNLKEKVEDFLIYLRPFEVDKREFSLYDLFKEIELENHEILKKYRIDFKLDKKNLKIKSDYKKLKKIFSNIIKNSIEAQEEGGVIEISMERTNDRVKVTISDRGTGIPEEEIEKIFSPFYTRKEKGTGLGLFIVKKLVDELKGKIKVYSKLGFGTKVEVELPEL